MAQFLDIEVKDRLLLIRTKNEELGPNEAEELRLAVSEWIDKDIKGAVVSLALAEYMSSIFLSALIEIMKEFKAKKMELALAELSAKNIEILRVTKLENVFRIFDSSYEACQAMKK